MKTNKVRNSFLFILLSAVALNVSAAKFDRAQVANNYHQLKEKADNGETLRVIVKVKGTKKEQVRNKKSAERKEMLRGNKQKHSGLKSHLSRHKIKLNREFDRLGYMTLEVTSDQLDGLIDSGLVDTVVEEPIFFPTLSESVPLIGADVAHASGYTGAGQAVVIIDTGVESSHPDFGGRVVEEACFSTASDTYTSMCPSGENVEIGVGAAEPCVGSCSHGTHVASIAAGANGVAPEANIVAIQAFSKNTTGSVRGQWGDLLAALEWVLESATTQNISSINMSLGNGTLHTVACDTSFLASTISDLRDAGIATVISSGNDSFTTGVASPACVSDAITVGSVTKLDILYGSSNSSELVDVLAPGVSILAAIPNGGYSYKTGTSMAAPHVAGAIAVLRSANPSASVDKIELSLENTGTDVTDPDNNVTKPRIEVNSAAIAVNTVISDPEVLWPNGIDAFASSEQDANPAVNVGDSDLSTRWSTQNAGETITFNLGDVYNVTSINIAFLKGDERNTYFDLATSTDGTTFTTISADIESSGSSNALESFALSGTAQYVRIIGQGNSSNNWNSLTEVEVLGTSVVGDSDVLSTNNLSTFEAAYSTQTISVTSNVNWAFSSNDSWIAIANNSGVDNGSSEIIVSENPSTNPREGSITLSGGSITKTIVVNQEGQTPIDAPTNLSVVVTNTGEITLNWEDVSAVETSYLVEYARYHEGESSTYGFESVSLPAGSTNHVVTGLLEDWYYVRVSAISGINSSDYAIVEWTHVKYVGVELVKPENFNVAVTAPGELTLTWDDVSSNETGYVVEYAQYSADSDTGFIYPYQATTIAANSTSHVFTDLVGDDYYDIRVSSIADDEQSEFSVIENFRVRWEGNEITLSTSSLEFDAAGESLDITVTANVNWTVSDDASWLTADATSGSNNGALTFTAEQNTSTDSRSATITVTGGASIGNLVTRTIVVTQAGESANGEVVIIEPSYVYSSSDDGNVADNAFDGDLNTRWSANGSGETMTIYLGDKYLVSDIQVAFFKGDTRQTSIIIEVSENTTNWTQVYDGISSGDTLSLEEVFTGSIDARYVRITGLGNTSNSWNSITEVQIKGSL